MKKTTSDEVFADVFKLKRLYTRIIVAEVTYYCSILVVWAAFYMNTIHPWWLLVLTIPVLAARVRFFHKKWYAQIAVQGLLIVKIAFALVSHVSIVAFNSDEAA